MYPDARSFLVQCGQFPDLSTRLMGDRLPRKAVRPETVFNYLMAMLNGWSIVIVVKTGDQGPNGGGSCMGWSFAAIGKKHLAIFGR
ncbi:Uncharacterized protein HZ326_22563 [Fusarium oxysporum f. sp. albedinis]|nr:Uncharacterized protein HZ326_22563 [Fusarium oxysporum f. sp. albedinis]